MHFNATKYTLGLGCKFMAIYHLCAVQATSHGSRPTATSCGGQVMTHLECFLHELHGIVLTHVRLVLLSEQWPRQHVAIACHNYTNVMSESCHSWGLRV